MITKLNLLLVGQFQLMVVSDPNMDGYSVGMDLKEKILLKLMRMESLSLKHTKRGRFILLTLMEMEYWKFIQTVLFLRKNPLNINEYFIVGTDKNMGYGPIHHIHI